MTSSSSHPPSSGPRAGVFRDFITSSGGKFPAEPNRYHLYVSFACPFAHRCLIARKLKGLEDIISVDVVSPLLDKSVGWNFDTDERRTTGDTVNGFKFLKEAYIKSDPNYSQSVTVPVLWDKKTHTIVNNESADIVRMFNSEFNEFAKNKDLDLYPEHLRSDIDKTIDWMLPSVLAGVYKCGFATTQEAYESAFVELFSKLDWIEDILSNNRYLMGDSFTEADIKLFVTLIRFDAAYYGLFKCNKKMIIEYPNMWNYVKDIYQQDGIKDIVDFTHIKKGYYCLKNCNPTQIYPLGPQIDYDAPHDRARFLKKRGTGNVCIGDECLL